jgi:hypothetical protein
MFVLGKRDYNNEIQYHLCSSEMREYGYFTVKSMEVEYEVPEDFNEVQAEIAMLREARAKVQVEAQAKINHFDDMISKLVCLEYKP